MNKTLEYYNSQSSTFIDRYNTVKITKLHQIFEKYIKSKDFVLDVGFGSGRDLRFIRDNITKKVFGIDGCEKFVEYLKEEDFFENRVAHSILPYINTSLFDVQIYNIVISIAVFMHLNSQDLELTIQNIYQILAKNGKIIISYSTTQRNNDKRSFYNLKKDNITNLFQKNGFIEIEYIVNLDNLKREICWTTQVFEKR